MSRGSLLQLQRTAGNRAVAQGLGGKAISVQRLVQWGTKQDNVFDGFLQALSDRVEEMATHALEPASLPDTPMVRNLLVAADAYTQGGRQAVPEFLYARYGYVVEDLVNQQVRQGKLDGSLPVPPQGRYVLQVQGGRGMTRPDIVVAVDDGSGKLSDVAWFDISSNTRGEDLHIWDKAGWNRLLYAGEAQYPRLDPTQIGVANLGMYAAIRMRRNHERYLTEKRSRATKLDGWIRLAWMSWEELPMAKRQKRLEQELGERFGVGKLLPSTTKAILGHVGREIHGQDNHWTAAFRYGSGRDSSSRPLLLIDSVEP